jgi:hypothetical protein
VTWPDAPVALRDDEDRDHAIDQLWAMPAGSERDRARTAIAAATARRISDAIVEDRPFVAALLLDQLTWIWQTDPTAVGRGLAPHAELLARLRAMFAKSGALEPAIQTLVLLAEVEPGRRAAHLAEIDEILAFADELAIADNGVHAGRAQPLPLLQPTALALPLGWLVDRYLALLAAPSGLTYVVYPCACRTAATRRVKWCPLNRASMRLAIWSCASSSRFVSEAADSPPDRSLGVGGAVMAAADSGFQPDARIARSRASALFFWIRQIVRNAPRLYRRSWPKRERGIASPTHFTGLQ